MKAVSGGRRALHTEKGILDAQSLLPGLPLPRQTIILTDENTKTEILSPGTNRKRSSSISEKTLRQQITSPTSKDSPYDDDEEDVDNSKEIEELDRKEIEDEKKLMKERKEKKKSSDKKKSDVS